MKETLDFILIGAQKAGTTSLFEYLRRHPEISLPAGKEAPYFSHDAVYDRGWQDYMAKAAFLDHGRKWGTVSPQYMIGGVYEPSSALAMKVGPYNEHTVPRRIRECLPDVRMVAILRDPIKRAYSHYQMGVMDGLERRSFDQAVAELLRPHSLSHSRQFPEETTGYVTWGEYGRILAGYFDVFPPEQILIAFTDELEQAPEQLLLRIYDFLDVTPDFIPDNLGTKYRTSGTERKFSWMSPYKPLSPQGLQRAATRSQLMSSMWHRLPTATRRKIRRGFEYSAYRIDLWNRQNRGETYELSALTVDRLRDHFALDTDRLAELIGVVPPWYSQTSG
jgi:Sulfotransferase domain